MAITVRSRELYQPALDEHGRFVGGERDYEGRLAILERTIDFTDKSVLDLGCSGGFFSFSIARKARSVVAVDADAHMIEKNQAAAEQHGFTNITFLCKEIGPQLLEELPRFDVVLFLSVFHHMIAGSGTYDWSRKTSVPDALQMLSQIRRLGHTFVFETGQADEGFLWCDDVAQLSSDTRAWVREHAFGDDFENVQTLKGAGYSRFPFNAAPWLRKAIPAGKYGKIILKILGIDIRDFRNLYVGNR